VSRFFPGTQFNVAGIVVTFHQVTVVAVAILTAIFLRLLLFRTRVGIAMRAVVDNRELAGLNGALPERVSQLAWVIGAVLAATAGVLLAPELRLDHLGLTLLVVNGYAAAMLGRLKSLPLTFAGAVALGLVGSYAVSYAGKYDFLSWLADIKRILPTIFLFLILVFFPQVRLRVGRVAGAKAPRVPGLRQSVISGIVFVAAIAVVSRMLSQVWLFNVGSALVIGMVMLSLVLLTGYSGQVSLMQMAFVGVGAITMGRVLGGDSIFGIVAAGVVAAAFGALVALPALRLQDLYLALTTLAFALFAEWAFDQPWAFDTGGITEVGRLRLPGVRFGSEESQMVLLAAAFAGMGILVLAIRRGTFGRRLAAMRDSPTACSMLGLNLVSTKTAVFAVSAGMAGVAGALFGGLRTTVGTTDFVMLQSLFVFLLAMFGGITSVTGALIGGAISALLPQVQEDYFPDLQLQGLAIGIGAIVISRYPNGFAGIFSDLRDRFAARPAPAGEPAAAKPPAEPELVEMAAS
jgi:branched-chain amino acid transport system permease protein